MDTAAQDTSSINIPIRNLTWFAVFLLLWKDEYFKVGTNSAQNPFRLRDIQIFIGQHPYNASTAYNSMLTQADFIILLFTNHNNRVKGGFIGHGCTVHPQGDLVAAMRR